MSKFFLKKSTWETLLKKQYHGFILQIPHALDLLALCGGCHGTSHTITSGLYGGWHDTPYLFNLVFLTEL